MWWRPWIRSKMNAVDNHGHNGNEKRWPARQDGSERSGPLFEDEDQNEKDDLLAKMKAREVDPFSWYIGPTCSSKRWWREKWIPKEKMFSLINAEKIKRKEVRAPYTERRIPVRNDDANSYRISFYFTHTKINYKEQSRKDIFILFIYL